MKLSELIASVGDENIKIQNLAQSLVRFNRKKTDSEITFATSHENGDWLARESMGGEPGSKLGLVIWLPRDKRPK